MLILHILDFFQYDGELSKAWECRSSKHVLQKHHGLPKLGENSDCLQLSHKHEGIALFEKHTNRLGIVGRLYPC